MTDTNQTNESALFPTYARFPITIVKGEGSKLWDDQGKEYLDLMSGIAVTNLGHVHPRVKASLVAQLDQLWHVSNLFHIPNQEKLAKLITGNSCADAIFFCNSGAEANEAAIKIARRYFQKVKNEHRYEVITFQQSFHGRTLATLTATGQEKVRDGFAPLPEGFVYAPFNDIEAVRAAVTPQTCAIMLEMAQAEGGVRPADPQFILDLAELCKEKGILLIADEIQTGVGRTGSLFAHQLYQVEPDIFTLAKGLGNGFPIGAMAGKAFLREAFNAGSHGTTFGGTPIATATAIAVLETVIEEKLSERAGSLGEWAMQFLREKLANNPLVKEVRGKGLLLGIECNEPVGALVTKAHEAGVLLIQAGPNVLRMLPALTISQAELEDGLLRVIDLLNAVPSEKISV